ncbi:unnamed protein product, partial [Cyprideis torosa]
MSITAADVSKLRQMTGAGMMDSKKALVEAEAADFGGIAVSEKLVEQTGVIGEKIEIGNFETLEAAFVGSYIHAGNKIAALVGLDKASDHAAEVAKDVCMQVAAMNPLALNESGIDQTTLDKEVEIAKEQLRQEGKPEEMLDKIAKGKLGKFVKENTLVNQMFIKDNKIAIKDYVKKEADGASVVAFKR